MDDNNDDIFFAPVLDKGFVRLIDCMGDDVSVVQAARVIPHAEWRGEKDEDLIEYLWEHKHTSPFEHVTMTFHVKCPIFTARQWMRHRTWSYNEVSARYKEVPEEFYIPDPMHVGRQSEINHQARVFTNMPKNTDFYRVFCEDAFVGYRRLLVMGWPRELARGVLPLATYTEFVGTVNLLNLFKFIKLRNDPRHAQYEIDVYAQAMLKMIKEIVPECVEVFEAAEAVHSYSNPEQEELPLP